MKLKNRNMELTLLCAGEEYRGTRFDWNGTVSQIRYKGTPLLSKELQGFAFKKRKHGQGLHNEFGIKDCIGYDEIPIGEWFPKIGVGWLKKDENPYFFATPYEMQKASFSETVSENSAVFTCTSGKRNGYAYSYTKKITLDQDGFTINYTLENTGDKKISTTEYVHNFLNPGLKKIRAGIELTVPWHFDQKKLSEDVQTQGIIQIENSEAGGAKIRLLKTPDKVFFMGGLWQARTDTPTLPNSNWTCVTENLTIKETDSFEPCNCDIWGYDKNISIEMFIRLNIEPGQNALWQRKYEFSENKE